MGCCVGKPAVVSDPQRVATWKKTGTVGMRDSNLKALPKEVLDLSAAIRMLDVTNNRLVELPHDINALSNLQRLMLAENKLQKLPSTIGSLQALKFLVLDYNNLTSLPPEIGQLPRLEKLSISGNMLQSLPDTFGDLRKLTLLDVSRNQMQVLPESIGGCVSLQEFDAHENSLVELPASIGNLKQLKSLILDHNTTLKQLPPNILKDCKALQTLSIHSTPIDSESLKQLEGYEDYETRRRKKHSKQIAGNVIMNSKGMDEGVDQVVEV